MDQYQKNKMNTVEDIYESHNVDKRKKLNRSDKQISEDTINVVRNEGITSEMLKELDVPVFKYLTQITIHGDWEGLERNIIGGYKWLFTNKNGSLGVKYNAIDFEKKKRVYESLQHVGWRVRKTSNEFYAFKTAEIAGNKQEALENGKELIKQAKEINTDYFIGGVEANLLHARFIGYVVELQLCVNAIYEKDVQRLIESVTGKSVEEIQQIKEEKQRQREKQREEQQKEWDRKAKRAEARRKELRKKLDNHDRLERMDEVLDDGFYIEIDVSDYSPDTDYPFKVNQLYKKGRQKLYRNETKTFKSIDEAIEYADEGGSSHLFGRNKQRFELNDVYAVT